MMEIITNNPEQCEKALAALKHVIDPEIGLNVVDLGLIYQIDFDVNAVIMSMTLTTQFCPMGSSIRSSAERALSSAFDGHSIEVNLVFNPPWNQSMISEDGRNFLNG